MITITIDTSNQAFEEYPEEEVGRILKEVTRRFKEYTVYDDMPIHDINGNIVGTVKRSN